MNQTTALAFKLKEMSGRIRELREIQNISQEAMAAKTGSRCRNTGSAKPVRAISISLSSTAAPKCSTWMSRISSKAPAPP